jgi:hypothetical protein
MAKPKAPNRHLPMGTDDKTRWVKFPTNPEMSARETCKAIDHVMQVVAYEVDLAKHIRQGFDRNPLRMIELYFNRFPSPELKAMGGTELHIQVVNAPISQGPVPGVLASPIASQVNPTLKLVVNASPVDTIDAEQ